MAKNALLLFGISFRGSYTGPHTNGAVKIDFSASVDNYKRYILDYFKPDVYISTYAHSRQHELLTAYAPRNFSFEQRVSNRNRLMLKGLQMIHNAKQNYQLVVATRFDLVFRVPFADVSIHAQEMNLVARLKDGLVCDNLYIFPAARLRAFIEFLTTNHKQSHYWERDLVRIFGGLNFLTIDPTWIGGLKFYKIVRNRPRALGTRSGADKSVPKSHVGTGRI